MSDQADRALDLAIGAIGAADRQDNPETEFHLRRAQVHAQVASARYLRTINASLATIAQAITRGAERIAPAAPPPQPPPPPPPSA